MDSTEPVTGADGILALCKARGMIDSSLFFLLLIIASVLLSFWSVVIQRRGVCAAICGEEAAAAALPNVDPIKCGAAAIVVGSLGFFLCLALDTLGTAEAGADSVAKKSAHTNVLAALLVFLAAVLRLADLRFVARCQPALGAEDTLPD